MFAMACIDRQNEIDRQKREKVAAATRREAVSAEKKRLKQMYREGTLQGIVDAINKRGVYV